MIWILQVIERSLWVLTLEYIIGAGWQGVSSLFVPSGLVWTLDLEFIGRASPIMRKANFYHANMMCLKSLDSWLSPGPPSTEVLGQSKPTLGVAYICLRPINTHTRSYIQSIYICLGPINNHTRSYISSIYIPLVPIITHTMSYITSIYIHLVPINTHNRSYIPSMVDEGPCLIRFLKSLFGSLHSQWLFLADPVPKECF
jgi:hypothetical protein